MTKAKKIGDAWKWLLAVPISIAPPRNMEGIERNEKGGAKEKFIGEFSVPFDRFKKIHFP